MVLFGWGRKSQQDAPRGRGGSVAASTGDEPRQSTSTEGGLRFPRVATESDSRAEKISRLSFITEYLDQGFVPQKHHLIFFSQLLYAAPPLVTSNEAGPDQTAGLEWENSEFSPAARSARRAELHKALLRNLAGEEKFKLQIANEVEPVPVAERANEQLASRWLTKFALHVAARDVEAFQQFGAGLVEKLTPAKLESSAEKAEVVRSLTWVAHTRPVVREVSLAFLERLIASEMTQPLEFTKVQIPEYAARGLLGPVVLLATRDPEQFEALAIGLAERYGFAQELTREQKAQKDAAVWALLQAAAIGGVIEATTITAIGFIETDWPESAIRAGIQEFRNAINQRGATSRS